MSDARSIQSPLTVCVLNKPLPNRAQPVNYPEYIFEILSHAGLCFSKISPDELAKTLPSTGMLLTVGEQELDEPLKKQIADWVNAGGAWLSIGGVCGLQEVLGVEHLPPTYANWGAGACLMGEGYALARHVKHDSVSHLEHALHFFGGIALKASTAQVLAGSLDAHCRSEYHNVLFENRPGRGRTLTLAVDVTGTIVRIQQGTAITRDGIPSPDGTAPVADAVLKSGDGGALDWILDRQPLPGSPGLNVFLEPVADLWREVVLRSLFHLASVCKVRLPLLWLYPRKLQSIAHLSHDSDGNEPEKARTLLKALDESKIVSTWCVILPGYDEKLMSDIKSAGHELATHYDSMTGTTGLTWGEKEFDSQHRALAALFKETPVTNKNHYLRWEGDVEFFDWCQKRGIALDQSKGPSKTGEAGFNFGSCHPYLPVRFSGEFIDVLELPTLTQDLVVFAPVTLVDALIVGVKRVHGILHLLFHPAHLHRPEVVEAMTTAVAKAKAAGMEWWTARQINTWERNRRSIRWSGYQAEAGSAHVTLQASGDLTDATVLWLLPKDNEDSGAFRAWGFHFAAEVHQLRASAPTVVGSTQVYA